MVHVGFNTWQPKICPVVFSVMNITNCKMVRIFQVNIPPGGVYDLLNVPHVSEADIRHSLLKGDLQTKILTNELRVVDSSIELLYFDDCYKDFLRNAGIIRGIDFCEESAVCGSGDGYLPFYFRDNIELVGPKNGANRVFRVPVPDKFLDGEFFGHEFHIIIDHNGRRLLKNLDYIISESGGAGTGYDTIEIISLTPNKKSKLFCDYVVKR